MRHCRHYTAYAYQLRCQLLPLMLFDTPRHAGFSPAARRITGYYTLMLADAAARYMPRWRHYVTRHYAFDAAAIALINSLRRCLRPRCHAGHAAYAFMPFRCHAYMLIHATDADACSAIFAVYAATCHAGFIDCATPLIAAPWPLLPPCC